MNPLNLKNKKVLVMGLGLHGGGVGTARFLVENNARVTVTDLKNAKDLAPSLKKLEHLQIHYVLGKHNPDDFLNTDLIIKNPSVPDDSPYLQLALKNQIPVDTDFGLFFQVCPSKNIIGITGTKGKSTTATLTHLLIQKEYPDAQIAGNIRVSPFSILNQIHENTPLILELSSWQLEGIAKHKISPHLAAITNIFPDHLNRYPSFNAYINSKKNIFKFQGQEDYVIMNYDNQILHDPKFSLNLNQIYWFSTKQKVKQGTFVTNGKIIFRNRNLNHTIATVKNIRLVGVHNLENVLAAITITCLYNLKKDTIQTVLCAFTGLPSRLELIREFKGVKYYNDTTSTTPISTIAALKSFPDKNIVLIAGGADKNLDFSELVKLIPQKVTSLLLLTGSATDKIIAEIKNQKISLPIQIFSSLERAIQKAQIFAREGDVILLSPACASFGMFQNEFDRGEQFSSLVQALK